MNTTCNHTNECNCECPSYMDCPLDNAPELGCEKNRSVARNRHHGKEKAKQNLKQSVAILDSKAKRIPDNAYEQVARAGKRAEQALKRASKIK